MSGDNSHAAKHWLVTRFTSLALIPLCLWLFYSLAGVAGGDQPLVQLWLKAPAHAGVLGLFLLVGFHHSASGVQEVIEDYISSENVKKLALAANRLLHLAAFGAALAAVISLALKG